MKKDKMIIGLLSVCLLISIVCIAVLATGVKKKTDDKIETQTELKTELKSEIETEGKTVKIAKLDETKDWVYNTAYETDAPKSYKEFEAREIFLSDIYVPYVNINSPYAEKINAEMKYLYYLAVDEYKANCEYWEKVYDPNFGTSRNDTLKNPCQYKAFVNGNCLSLLVSYDLTESAFYPIYYVYNINLETGDYISDEKIREIAGKDQVDSIKELEKENLKEITESYSMKGSRADDTSAEEKKGIELVISQFPFVDDEVRRRYCVSSNFLNENGVLCEVVDFKGYQMQCLYRPKIITAYESFNHDFRYFDNYFEH